MSCRLSLKLTAALVGVVVAFAAGQAGAFALTGSGSSPTDTSPVPTDPAPVTTVVAPTTTAPAVTPDAPPPPTIVRKPPVKAAPAPKPTSPTQTPVQHVTQTPVQHVTQTPVQSVTRPSTSGGGNASAQLQTVVKRPASTPRATHHETAHDRAVGDRRRRAAEAAQRAAKIAALYRHVPRPAYPLTPPGGGEHPRTPIRHFVFLLQENHTFDNYFGTYGHNSDGLPAGVCMPLHLDKSKGRCIKPFRLAGRAVTDLGHSNKIFLGQYNNGRMNGFANILRLEGQDPSEVMGYYDGRDIPYYWNLADRYVLFDRFFSSATEGSGANHFFWVAGYPADPHGAPKGGFTVPTIFDRLEKAGVSWKFYVSNYDPGITYRTPTTGDRASQLIWVPLLSYARFLDDPKLARHIVPLSQYYKDLTAGTLPAVSYITPSGASEHPPGSIDSGQQFVRTLINNLVASSAWSSSAFLLSYDDWGGWYDHVKPPQIDPFGYGFRVPALLVSPYARRGYVDHTTLDFTSALKFIEENWGVAPLTIRDAHANSIANAFDFSKPSAPAVIVPATRHVALTPAAKRSVIYPAYGLGALLVVILVVAAFYGSRRRGASSVPAVAGELDA